MPTEINIIDIVGVPPYDILVCDCQEDVCELVGRGITVPPPFTFSIPDSLSGETCFKLIVIDSTECTFKDVFYPCTVSDCTTTSYVPPITIGDVNITATYTGDVIIPPTIDDLRNSSCNFTLKNVIGQPLVGFSGQFTYTYNFSLPVNNAVLTIKGTGVRIGGVPSPLNEIFTITTNGGVPEIIDIASCQTTINGNVISSGANTPYGGGSGGRFTISAPLPYTELTVEGPQNVLAGSNLHICIDPDSPVVTPTPSVTEGYIYPTPTPTKTPTRTPTPTPTQGLGGAIFAYIPNISTGTSQLTLVFNNIDQVNVVNDVNNLSQWNTFFNAISNPFTDLMVNGNTIILEGGSNIILPNDLFNNVQQLISVIDNGCFSGCNNRVFENCANLRTFESNNILNLGDSNFKNCLSLLKVETPSVLNVGDSCFNNCSSLLYLNLESCVTLGTTSGSNNVFQGVNGQRVGLTIPTSLNTDGDIINLLSNNTVLTLDPNALNLTFDNVSNSPVSNPNQVSDWNTLFSLPTQGGSFTSVSIVGNTVQLFGGTNITLKPMLFLGSQHLIDVHDLVGCVVGGEYACFSICEELVNVDLPSATVFTYESFNQCPKLETVNLPNVTTMGHSSFYYCPELITVNLQNLQIIDDYSFEGCESLVVLDLPSLLSADYGCFLYCTSLTSFSAPNMTLAKDQCFEGCTSLVNLTLTNLEEAGWACFSDCSSLTQINLPNATTIGVLCFANCFSLTQINLPSCQTLGFETGFSNYCQNNNVFFGINGNTINLTIPSPLLNCDNSGIQDGDITYLQTNNTVTLTIV